MPESEKKIRDAVYEDLKRKLDSLFSQRSLSSDLVEHFARQIVSFDDSRLETPNFWSLGYVDDLAKLCRHFLDSLDSYQRLGVGVESLSVQLSAIKDLK